MKILYFFLFYVATAESISYQERCHTENLDYCIAPFLLSMRNFIPANQNELDNFCRQLNRTWNCTDNFMQNCFTMLDQQIFGLLSEKVRIRMEEFCNYRSTLQIKFVKESRCMSEVSKDSFVKCRKNLNNLIFMLTGDNVDQRIPAGCCLFNQYYDCFLQKMGKSCGNESLRIFSEISETVAVNYIRNFCSSYDSSGDICADLFRRKSVEPSKKNSYLVRLLLTWFR
ncbi:uncharacterized protein [Centruroides vittatus]|uniref:uncharacterized protein isoform X1 n=1 Tax=Centruroides vittatus TaxID=120091 RepID=UPI00350FE648